MPRSILIVGGGSAGWITANVLNALLGKERGVEITLVESPSVPIIGVGEATVPSIRRTLQTIGTPERDFMRATDATFKSLIRFVDWNIGQVFDHPFDRRLRPESDAAVDAWLEAGLPQNSFAKAVSLLSNLADANHAPKALGWPDYASTFPYAYHLDAVKLASYLSRLGAANGIRHSLANVTNVTIDEAGFIDCVQTDMGEALTADLYVDCTGFRARLIGEALNVPARGFSDKILCDRAVTMRVPYEVCAPPRIRPYTLSTARGAGWIWDINLRNRRGVGYVYSSRHISDESAELELRTFEGAHASDLPAQLIKFATSKRTESWRGNCVAIGLADAFLEPLESSGIYMIEFAAQALGELFPYWSRHDQNVVNRFNICSASLFEEVLEFVNLHYVTSTRRDTPFWRAATESDAVAPSLAGKLELWRRKRPTDLDFTRNQRLFSLESHEYLLFGMGLSGSIARTKGTPLPSVLAPLQKCLAKLPPHEQWLSSLDGENYHDANAVPTAADI